MAAGRLLWQKKYVAERWDEFITVSSVQWDLESSLDTTEASVKIGFATWDLLHVTTRQPEYG